MDKDYSNNNSNSVCNQNNDNYPNLTNLTYLTSGSHQKKKLPNFGYCPNMGGGGQRHSQTFYRKKVWTYFKGGGGSKGLVQSSFLQKKSMYFRSTNSFFILN